MSKFTDPIRDLRRCRFCGLDTIEAADIKAHEDTCEDAESEPLSPEGDRGPNYEPDTDLDTDAFDDWREECPEAEYGDIMDEYDF